MSLDQLEYKELPPGIEEKILSFAQLHKTFTTTQLFEQYPNNPSFILRYGLNNLRIKKQIFMHGLKRGAFYSLLSEEEKEEERIVPDKQIAKNNNIEIIKGKILEQQTKFATWFKRTDLNLYDAIPEILAALKELEAEKKITIRGTARWTEYFFGEPSPGDMVTSKIENQSDLKSQILQFIKKQKVVTIPILVDELNLQRYQIIPFVEELILEEEIWHEGIKKGSKYIYKDVPSNEVESILSKLNEERKIDEQIDELSEFLISGENATCIGIGIGKNEKFEIKMMKNGTIVYRQEYENFQDGFKKIHDMTTVGEG